MSKARKLTLEEELNLRVTPRQFGEMLQAKRVSRGQTMNDLALQLKVSPTTIKRWEHGIVDPPGIRLMNWLFEGEAPSEGMWRTRALVAEAALRDVTSALAGYRSAMRPLNGAYPGSAKTNQGKPNNAE